MNQDNILRLLIQAGGSVSGEEMSRRLGVTRAAVWKGIEALRSAGYEISSVPGQGYRLVSCPNRLSAGAVSARLSPEAVVGHEIVCLEQVDSTNTYLKRRGAEGASHGLAALAEEQTGGRGRRGRRFESPRGAGLYLSVLLRPDCAPAEAVTLTAWVGVAVCDAVEQAAGVRPRIKWTNDIILNGKKLCGILTEFALLAESGEPDYVVIGMGVNMNQTVDTFQAQGLEDIATSLALEGYPVEQNHLAVCLLEALDKLNRDFPANRADYLDRYRAHCVTLGRRVSFDGEGTLQTGTVAGVDDNFALLVDGDDGKRHIVSSGTVKMI